MLLFLPIFYTASLNSLISEIPEVGHHIRGYLSGNPGDSDQVSLSAVSKKIRGEHFFNEEVYLDKIESARFCENPRYRDFMLQSMVDRQKLHVDIDDSMEDWRDCVLGLHKVVLRLTQPDDFTFLANAENVLFIELSTTGDSLEALLHQNSPALKKIKILNVLYDLTVVYSIEGIAGLEIEEVNLGSEPVSLLPLRELPKLKHLGIQGRLSQDQLNELATLTELKSLSLDGSIDFLFEGFGLLEKVVWKNLSPGFILNLPPGVRDLNLEYRAGDAMEDEFDFIAQCVNLRNLTIATKFRRRFTLPSLAELTQLQRIELSGFQVEDLDFLYGLKTLDFLKVEASGYMLLSSIRLSSTLHVKKSQILFKISKTQNQGTLHYFTWTQILYVFYFIFVSSKALINPDSKLLILFLCSGSLLAEIFISILLKRIFH